MAATKVISVNFGTAKASLSTVGYTLLNSDNTVKLARVTAGVSESVIGGIHTGIYGALVSFDDDWKGRIVWDTGEATPRYSIEDYNAGETIVVSPGSTGTFTYDISTNLGKVRNLIGDTDGTAPLMTDGEINAILSLMGSDILKSAGMCCLKIASNKALLTRKRTSGDYSEDLTAMAKEYREQAKTFNEWAMSVPAEAVAEQFFTDFAYRQLLVNKELRSESD